MNKKDKFCCEKLKGLHSFDKTIGLNFRVIKISEEFKAESLKRGGGAVKNYSFLLTDGYSEKLSSGKTKVLFIAYCPFCGKKLSKVYEKDSLVNEQSHVW